MKRSKIQAAVFAGAFLCCFLWASAFPGIKIGYRLWGIQGSDTWRIIRFAGVRFFLAGLLVILFASIARRELLLPKAKEMPKIILLSAFQIFCNNHRCRCYAYGKTHGEKNDRLSAWLFWRTYHQSFCARLFVQPPGRRTGCAVGTLLRRVLKSYKALFPTA